MDRFSDLLLRLLKNQFTILGIVLAVSLYFLLRRNPRLKYHLAKFGGPSSIPVLGGALHLLCPRNEVIPLIGSWMKEYGKTFAFWVGNIVPYVFIADADVLEKIISGSNNLDKGKYEYSFFTDWLGTGNLLTAPGSKWVAKRKLLTPSFHFKILEDFIPVFNEQASIMMQCLKKDGHESGQIFNMYQYITKCTLDIICETAMGKKINAQTSSANKKYIDAVNGMCSVILDKTLKPWLRIPIFYEFTSYSKLEKRYLEILKGFSKEVIEARKRERKMAKENTTNSGNNLSSESEGIYGKKRKAFLDLLLECAEDNEQLTDADIWGEVDTFMFEGHDTTSMNLVWTILMLAMHMDYQQIVQKELDEIFADDPTRDVTTGDISKMKYLNCCIKESLRIYPSVPFIMRQINEDIALDNEKIIPKGATAFISIFYLHRDPKVFPDPEKFIPERFSDENTSSARRHPYAYIPFSAGPRNCIGQKFAMMELKVILAKLFRTCTIETTEKMENLKPLPDVVLRCENGIYVKLKKR